MRDSANFFTRVISASAIDDKYFELLDWVITFKNGIQAARDKALFIEGWDNDGYWRCVIRHEFFLH